MADSGENKIAVTISADRLVKLQEAAGRFGVSLEDLVRASIEDFLARPDDVVQRAIDYVLRKNAELYRRLA